MSRIAIFASGTGTNAKNIIDYFKKPSRNTVEVGLIVTNNPNAGVLKIAEKEKIQTIIINKENFGSDEFLEQLKKERINLIVLAGFLWLIPKNITQKYHNKIVNIHPALLPRFGGKGMFGSKVHQTVKESGELESGISIHFVNEHYDKGEIIFQARCELFEDDSPEVIEQKVRKLEYKHYPIIIADLLNKQ
jgi:phosphoribosylglycinamide formyltransferase 1